MEKNLTTGSVFKAILTFALPYLLSYFLQTLYGMADLYITGRFCGVDSITAVANGSQGVFADKFARHQAVGNVVKLLKNDAAKQRQAEGPQHLFWLSYG